MKAKEVLQEMIGENSDGADSGSGEETSPNEVRNENVDDGAKNAA